MNRYVGDERIAMVVEVTVNMLEESFSNILYNWTQEVFIKSVN